MTTANATVIIDIQAEMTPDSPLTGRIKGNASNGSRGRSWTNGVGSGQIGQVYREQHTIGTGATVSFNTLSAGGLIDIAGDAVDLDELKWLYIEVVSGRVEFIAPAANFLDVFKATGAALDLAPGHKICLEWAAAGLDVTTNSKWDITDITTGSVVEVSFGGAK